MAAAIEAVQKGDIENGSAKRYGVSRGALRQRLHSKTPANPHAYKQVSK